MIVSSPLNVITLEQVIFSEYCVVLNYQTTVPTVMKDQEHTQNQNLQQRRGHIHPYAQWFQV